MNNPKVCTRCLEEMPYLEAALEYTGGDAAIKEIVSAVVNEPELCNKCEESLSLWLDIKNGWFKIPIIPPRGAPYFVWVNKQDAAPARMGG